MADAEAYLGFLSALQSDLQVHANEMPSHTGVFRNNGVLMRSQRLLWLVPEGLWALGMLLSTEGNPGHPEIIDLV